MSVEAIGPDLTQLTRELDTAEERLQAELCSKLGAAGQALVLQGFQQSTDPYGRPWAPLKYRLGKKLGRGKYGPRRAGKPLMDTGNMRGSLALHVEADGFTLSIAARYAVYHQKGAPRAGIERRQMLPEEETGGLGPVWEARFDAVSRSVAAGIFGRMH